MSSDDRQHDNVRWFDGPGTARSDMKATANGSPSRLEGQNERTLGRLACSGKRG